MTNDPIVAVSSIRPMGESEEVDRNQLRAIRSWTKVFPQIYLFGPYSEQLDFPQVQFIDAGNHPQISLLMFAAVMAQPNPVAILNADIVVAEHLQQVAHHIWIRGFAFTSQRYEFDPATENYDSAKIKDLGCDFFCAMPPVWNRAWREIPDSYRIGGGQWDSWTLGFLGTVFRKRFFCVNSLRLIFHPIHVERKRPVLKEAPRDRYITSGLGFPPNL